MQLAPVTSLLVVTLCRIRFYFLNFSVHFTSPIFQLLLHVWQTIFAFNESRCFDFLTLKSRQCTLFIVTFTDLYTNNAIAVLIYGLYYRYCFITDNIQRFRAEIFSVFFRHGYVSGKSADIELLQPAYTLSIVVKNVAS